MYRDLIGDPEKIVVGGSEWWLQQFCRADGTLKDVQLFDSTGKPAGSFQSVEDAISYAERA